MIPGRGFRAAGEVRHPDGMSSLPGRFDCAHCGRAGSAADVATGWSVSRPPRPTGFTAAADETLTALCPDCARRVLRDLEGKLGP